MKSRITLVFLVFLGLWVLVIARAAYLQILPNQRLSQLHKRQFETTVTLQSRRGAITDRNGQELAVSLRSFSLYADPKLIEAPRGSSRRVAKVLGQSAETVLKKVQQAKGRRFVWIQRHLTSEQKEQIESMKLKGFAFVQESKRVYPNGPLLANTLGFVGQEGQGLEGIESRFDEQLQNRKRKVSFPRDARGRPLIVNGQYFAENLDGSDVELTIDQEIQYVLERELARTTSENEADAAVGIVIDVKTSEIRAIAQVPTFDPNNPLASSADARRNRLVTDAFEPGSVMKPFVVAGALSAKKIQPNSKFDCEGGRLKIGKRIVREAEVKENFHWLTVTEILAFSSNVGVTKIAFDFGEQGVYDTLTKFGFGEKTGVDLPGEAKGILHELPWRPHHFANIAFGHGISATPLQVANAYLAIANGGVLRTPTLIKKIRDIDTGETEEFSSRDIRRVLTKEQAEQLTLMLTAVTQPGGTGAKARVQGYPVAGKTGTAQKVRADGKGYMDRGYISSFAGFVPANDPQYVIYVAVDNPKKRYYAAATAAPVFANVASFALRKAMIPPVFISENNLIQEKRETVASSIRKDLQESVAPSVDRVPNFVGLSLREVYRVSHGQNLDIRTVGEGWVVRTEPSPNELWEKNKKVTLYLEPHP